MDEKQIAAFEKWADDNLVNDRLRDDFRIVWLACYQHLAPMVKELSSKKIETGWHQTFSTNNPFCPCDLKSFTKAVRWAERAINAVREQEKKTC